MLETSAACLCNFNPHSPEGSDWNPKSEMLRFQEFQSTPPMKGATVHVAYEASHVLISIHAPVKGATLQIVQGLDQFVISIHAPVKGATDYEVSLDEDKYDFNPHSREGSDPPACHRSRY